MAAGTGGRDKPKSQEEPTNKKPAPAGKAATKEKSGKGK
jgi:hypothetical protein